MLPFDHERTWSREHVATFVIHRFCTLAASDSRAVHAIISLSSVRVAGTARNVSVCCVSDDHILCDGEFEAQTLLLHACS